MKLAADVWATKVTPEVYLSAQSNGGCKAKLGSDEAALDTFHCNFYSEIGKKEKDEGLAQAT